MFLFTQRYNFSMDKIADICSNIYLVKLGLRSDQAESPAEAGCTNETGYLTNYLHCKLSINKLALGSTQDL